MDIEYNLSQIMNAIKSKEQQNHTGLKFLPSTMNNRRRHTYVGTTVVPSEVEVTSSWKQNYVQSQVDR